MRRWSLLLALALAFVFFSGASDAALAQATPKPPPTPSASINRSFDEVNGKILATAKDLPADKYSYRPAPGLRSFAEVLVHITSGNVYAAKAGRGEKVQWNELDAKKYPGKTEIVAALDKSINDAKATLKATPDSRYAKTLEPWVAIIEHAGEHYGQLVVYYRNNRLVPPESRKPNNQ